MFSCLDIDSNSNPTNDLLDQSIFKTVVASAPLVSIDLCFVFEGKLLLGLRQNEPIKGQWFTPGGRLRKNERWQDGLIRIAKSELGMDVVVENFELMGVWDHFYHCSAVSQNVSTHYVNLPHVSFLDDCPSLTLDDQHLSSEFFNIDSITVENGYHEYVSNYAKWISESSNFGRFK